MFESASKSTWLEQLRQAEDPRRLLRRFAPHYYYFSLRQVIAFTGLFRWVPARDAETLALLADVLSEELGRGSAERVHSVLFGRFALATGAAPEELELSRDQVLPGVRAYVEELESSFLEGPAERALAAYLFLESSAVLTYAPLLEYLRTLRFAEDDLEFFALHATVEIEHERGAAEMVRRAAFSGEARQRFEAQLERMHRLWDEFWSGLAQLTERTLHGHTLVR